MPQRIRGLIAINIAALIFGSAALYGKLPISPLWLVAGRAFFAALVLGGLSLVRREDLLKAKAFSAPLLRTGLLLCLHWITFFASVQSSGIAVATLTFASFPLFSIALESFAEKKFPALVKIAAVLTILLAVGLLAGTESANLFGVVTGIASAFFFAAFGLGSKKLNQYLGPLTVSFFQNLVVALALAPLLPSAQPAPTTTLHWLSLISLGVFTTALMHQLYFYALRRLPASTCSGFVALEPVYAILLAAFFFGETITPLVLVSGVLILGASFALFWSKSTLN